MRVCYFGIFDPDFSRSRILMRGLREIGVEIIECRDNTPGPLKYPRLFLKHWKIRNDYDVLVVGFTGYVAAPLAKLISKKRVVFDALASLYEGDYISRKQGGEWSPKIMYVKLLDWLAVKCSDVVLVESEQQKKFMEERFGVKKFTVIYTGADDNVFHPDETIAKHDSFTVVFRGRLLPESGILHVMEAARLLEDEGVQFIILSSGMLEGRLEKRLRELRLKNIQWRREHLTYDELRNIMLSCHVSLGQLEDHERLSRTIPHKCFESLAMGLPYITARTKPIEEILNDGENCIMVNPADSHDIAEKILFLKNNPELMQEVALNGRHVYLQKFTPGALARQLISLL